MSTVPVPERRLEYLRLDDVVPALRNPKLHAQEKVEASMARFGFTNPVLMDERTGRLVAGHGRLEALRGMQARGEPAPNGIVVMAGIWLIPVTRGWASKDDREADAYLLADNQLTMGAGWDEEQLAQMMRELDAADVDLSQLGWSGDELAALVAESKPEGAEDPGPQDPPAMPGSVFGEVYQLGPHRLMCGDSTNAEMVARLMNGEKAALLATDPPYLVDYDGSNHFTAKKTPLGNSKHMELKPDGSVPGSKRWDDYNEASATLFERFLDVALAHCIDAVPVYQWHATVRQGLVEAAWKKNGLLWHQTIQWVKEAGVLTRSHFLWRNEPCAYGWREGQGTNVRRPPANETTVWEISRKGHQDGIHPTQKPLEIFARPIRWQTLPGDLCFEPFGGSGSCMIAAASEGRRCYAMELSPAFCDAIRKRWGDYARSAGLDPGPGAL